MIVVAEYDPELADGFRRAAPAHEYGAFKKRLARQDADESRYADGKTDMLLRILAAAGLRSDDLETITRTNRRAV